MYNRPPDRERPSVNAELMEEEFEDEILVPNISKAAQMQASRNDNRYNMNENPQSSSGSSANKSQNPASQSQPHQVIHFSFFKRSFNVQIKCL